MATTIGIDAGGTLLKIAYTENGKTKFRQSDYSKADSLLQWLKMLAPNAAVSITGGRARWAKENFFPSAFLADEFQTLCTGASMLYSKDADAVGTQFLLVNIGTGTSIHLVGNGSCKRLGGTGLGGGTLTGLGQLLAGTSDFDDLVSLASKGDRRKADLLVKDIYGDGREPLSGELTAANFGKSSSADKADLMAALMNLIAETVVLLSSQAALSEKVESVVFAGSTLTANQPLKDSLAAYTTMFGLKPVFLENGEFCGALGALMENRGAE
ncbi:type II pantothenate kinase [Neobacillus notoginsengisoli]|uniref:Type II pantothenate kinase n=1 Tax=Neobacillus notoginsengisoli TaxID=1578198 RepID=A0A417YRX0_9BACI|nr:type II pantothenate kinase [Neobacillus notoginsengisoli]RHW38044.1 type II pantothenate kinase [Neobacillus notoginsengisoli]